MPDAQAEYIDTLCIVPYYDGKIGGFLAMGYEYKLSFEAQPGTDIVGILAHLDWAAQLSDTELEFRSPPRLVGMPDAQLELMPFGLYFCDYGGSGRDILGRVVSALLTHCPAVIVEDWE